MNFKIKFKLDRRGLKNQDGTFDENAVCPIKVNLHSIASNRNYDFKIKDVILKDGSLIKFQANTKDFQSIWLNRLKKNSFGDVTGETTVYGQKMIIRTLLKAKEDILNEIISKQGVTDYKQVKRLFYDYKKENVFVNDVYSGFNKKIKDLVEGESSKTAASYESTLNNIKRYNSFTVLNFNEITIEWLKKYDRFRRKSVAPATVGVDMRNLRTIFKAAIKINPSLEKNYPFGVGKYQIPEGDSKNAALTKAQLLQIQDFNSQNHYLQMGRDYFIFSYYANGMNLKDIAKLKKGQTHWVRSKTEFTSKNEKRLDIDFNDEMLEIVSRHKGKGKMLFDILEDGDDSRTITKKVDNKISAISKQIKKITKILALPEQLSFQWARHSYATNVYRSGVNLKAISETLGHSSLKTTENYLNSLKDENKKAIDDAKRL